VLPLLPPFLRPRGRVLALVKPQFEVGAEYVGRGGIVRDPNRRALALRHVMTVAERAGFRVLQVADAPCLHAHGNQEIFIDLGWAADQATTAMEQQPISA
jgi:23S rRNA (cytidine1920-2'-O)/16S rRNA (cytidine1409-2'-O)-methyltransferase